MQKFVLLFVLASIATSSLALRRYRDVSLGYKYQPGYSSSGSGSFLSAPIVTSYQPTSSGTTYYNSFSAPARHSTIVGGGGSGGGSGSSGFSYTSGGNGFGSSYSGNRGSANFGGIGIGSGLGGSSGGGLGFTSGGSGSGGLGFATGGSSSSVDYNEQQAFFNQAQQQAPIVSKHFYVHSAPEDHDEQQIVKYLNIGQPRQNYKVVFINTPSSNVARAKIIANVAPVEDKTAIYVLSRKASDLDVSAEVVTPAPVDHKPDVFFIKYKTPQEAEHAQNVIQSQYDSLGGSSDVSNEGTIPVTSVIGSLGGESSTSSGHSNHVIRTGINSGIGTNYVSSGSSGVGTLVTGSSNTASEVICSGCSNSLVTDQSQTSQVSYLPPSHK